MGAADKKSRCDAIKQSQRHGRMSAESPDESGQVTARLWKQLEGDNP